MTSITGCCPGDHSKRPSSKDDLSGAPLDLPLDVFMYYVMVCEVCTTLQHLLLPMCCALLFHSVCCQFPLSDLISQIQVPVKGCCLTSSLERGLKWTAAAFDLCW